MNKNKIGVMVLVASGAAVLSLALSLFVDLANPSHTIWKNLVPRSLHSHEGITFVFMVLSSVGWGFISLAGILFKWGGSSVRNSLKILIISCIAGVAFSVFFLLFVIVG